MSALMTTVQPSASKLVGSKWKVSSIFQEENMAPEWGGREARPSGETRRTGGGGWFGSAARTKGPFPPFSEAASVRHGGALWQVGEELKDSALPHQVGNDLVGLALAKERPSQLAQQLRLAGGRVKGGLVEAAVGHLC